MEAKVLIKYSLKAIRNELAPFELKDYINGEINDGIMHSGYYLAVKNEDITSGEANEILHLMREEMGISDKLIDDAARIIGQFNFCSDPFFYFFDNHDFLVADYSYVYYYSGGELKRKSVRISIDGFYNLNVDGNYLTGQWYDPCIENAGGHPYKSFSLKIDSFEVEGGCGWKENIDYRNTGILLRLKNYIKSKFA